MIQNSLFENEKRHFVLLDSTRNRIILKLETTKESADKSNEFFKKSLTPHLQYVEAERAKELLKK